MSHHVRFFFDFLSPYSYIASELIARDAGLQAKLDYSPIVFGTLLSHRGVKGPGEIPRQREIGLIDNMLLSQTHDIAFEAPPRHPFNPLYALRSTFAVEDPVKRRALTHEYFRLAWQESASLEDMGVLKSALARVGIDQDPETAAGESANRSGVKALTKLAIDKGVTGVPTFLVDDDIVIFGGDRLDMLRGLLSGSLTLDRNKLESLMSRGGTTRVV